VDLSVIEEDEEWEIELENLVHVMEEQESARVRALVAQRLRKIFQDHRKAIYDSFDTGEKLSSLPGQVLSVLFKAAREVEDEDIDSKHAFAECIGEVAAIDGRKAKASLAEAEGVGEVSGKEGRKLPGSLDRFHQLLSFEMKDDVSLAVNIIKMQVKLIRSSPISQVGAGYAIQELLKICISEDLRKEIASVAEKEKEGESEGKEGVSSSPTKGECNNQVWSEFADDEKALLLPFLTSKYVNVSPPSDREPKLPGAILHRSANFKQWVCGWASHLLARIPEEKIPRVLTACTVVIEESSRVAIALLPYLLRTVILSGINKEEDIQEITEEITAVILQGKDREDDGKTKKDVSTLSSTTSASSSSTPSGMGLNNLRQRSSSSAVKKADEERNELEQMSIQTVFSMVDFLSTWYRKQVLVMAMAVEFSINV
tara:strand:- start:444 stop:1730 length:1287 start_codon:yes stop_codon:yes gene_type:complete